MNVAIVVTPWQADEKAQLAAPTQRRGAVVSRRPGS
jgi:hypothetical protein